MSFMNNISIRMKLLLTYIIIVTLPIIIIGYFLTSKLEYTSLSSIIQLTNINLNQLDSNFMSRCAIYEGMVDSLMKDSFFVKYLFTEFDDEYESYTYFKDKINPYISRLIYNDRNTLLKVYTNNKTIGFSSTTNNSLQDMLQENWYIDSTTKINLSGWSKPTTLTGRDGKYLCYYKKILENNSDKINVAVAVFFEEEELYSLISEEGKGGKVAYLLDDGENIITSTDREVIGETISDVFTQRGYNINQIKTNQEVDYKGSKYYFFTRAVNNELIGVEKWKIVYLVPAGQIISVSRTIWITSIVIIIVSILVSFVIILLVSSTITLRISRLIQTIKKVKERNFKVMVDVSGEDEIGTLESDFNHMLNTIDRLIKEVYESEIRYQRVQNEKKEAEIIALQGQINPHYLFNTLETIRLNLVIKGDREIANIVKLFADSFRNCIESREDLVTLAEELKFVENYFSIQTFRFGSKINLLMDIRQEWLDIMIPKLLVQPIVENAVYHGLEPKEGKGYIRIAVEKKESAFCICISDDGVGMDDEELERLKQTLYSKNTKNESRPGNGMALRNVHNRLRLIYGEAYGLTIKSHINIGTIVEINLPIQMALISGRGSDV